MRKFENLKIAVAGTGYVGLSIATLLAQHHQVTAVDVIPEKVEKINKRISPIQDDYIEMYLAEYCGSELKIEPKMLYRFDSLKLAWVSQKESLDEFNSIWKGIITFKQARY